MVRNIFVLGGNSHPDLAESICSRLGLPPAKALLGKFAVGETRVEINESVRGKDVFIIQSASGKVNDHLMELLITISACKIASASRITAVLPLFPYSRQGDLFNDKSKSQVARMSTARNDGYYSIETHPKTPQNGCSEHQELKHGIDSVSSHLSRLHMNLPNETMHDGSATAYTPRNGITVQPDDEINSAVKKMFRGSVNGASKPSRTHCFKPQRGYKQWVAQSGKLIADLLTCAGADHVITMDLHDPQYQGFFDIPVDNLYGRHLLSHYIQRSIENYQDAVIVSPDAGGAKRATAIADALGMPFALIHNERRPTQFSERQNSSMMLVGNVHDRTVVLIDDMADTCITITRAAKLLKKEGANKVYALITHGILSGEAVQKIKNSSIDKLVVTNSVDQKSHKAALGDRLEVLEVASVFAEAIRRVHHGESISVLFQLT